MGIESHALWIDVVDRTIINIPHAIPGLGRNKAIMAIARKMLVVVWHILYRHEADKRLDLERLARKYYEFAYTIGKANWGGCPTVADFIRCKLDQAGVGREMTSFRYARRSIQLPPSTLPPTSID